MLSDIHEFVAIFQEDWPGLSAYVRVCEALMFVSFVCLFVSRSSRVQLYAMPKRRLIVERMYAHGAFDKRVIIIDTR